MKYYVYIHYKKDDNQPFYIGKGSGRRHLKSNSRNAYWKNTVAKHGFKSEILKRFATEEEAFSFEVKTIQEFIANDVKLTNLTAGGEGLVGAKWTPERYSRQLEINAEGGMDKQIAAVEAWRKDPKNQEKMCGEGNHSYLGDIVGTNTLTGEQILLFGAKDIDSKGFHHTNVYRCVNGVSHTHKGFTFKRVTKE